ncbi:hypothetical protein PHPALM_29307 [Phytophthora palmivora]|uniref:ATP-binding cassette (ABC) Superfamily n=1 Tax=Phytophthora palmivora TaxID=4796 RepID=A0A2P4X7Z0_9STRA|nr:hypothetical protein PHPALM_29307 [Phytophthora palmivora]
MSVAWFRTNHSLSMTLRPLGYPWVQPKNTTTPSQAEDLLWRWASLKNFTLQELKELREDRLLSYGLDQRDHRIEFAHLIAKRQLHSVMEGLSQQSKPSAHDERISTGVEQATRCRTFGSDECRCSQTIPSTWKWRTPFRSSRTGEAPTRVVYAAPS